MRTVTVLLLIGAGVFGEDKPKPIADELVKAWKEEAGAKYGCSAASRLSGFQANDPFEEKTAGVGQLPTFSVNYRYKPGQPRVRELADLQSVPLPEAPFALFLYEWAAHGRVRQAARFTTIESLNCSCAQVSDEDFKHLKPLRNLRTLDLSLTSVSWAIPSALTVFPELTELNIGGTLTNDSTAAQVVEKLPKLRALSLSDTAVSDVGLESLAKHGHLRHLYLRGVKLTDDGLKWPAAMPLHTLDLGLTKITDAGLKHLRGMKHLESLMLYSTSITDRGVNELAGLTQLRQLNLQVTGGIGVEGLKVVCEFASLEALIIRLDAKVSEDNVLGLARLPKIKQLHLTQSTLDAPRIARLQKEMPECKITWSRNP